MEANRRDDEDMEGQELHHQQQSKKVDLTIMKVGEIFSLELSQLKYLTFMIMGVALLWPWNCFLSASAFYGTRFSNTLSLVKIYSSTMMSVSTITSTAYNFYLSQKQTGVNYRKRVHIGLNMTIFIFVFMAITCVVQLLIDMDDTAFFIILMFMVFLSAAATCLAQNGVMAMVNVMGSRYANAVMVGQAIAGVLPSCALIVSVLLVGEKGSEEKHKIEKDFGVFMYYITASLICIVGLSLLYLVTQYESGLEYHKLDQITQDDNVFPEEEGQEEEEREEQEEQELVDSIPTQKQFVPFFQLWSKLKLIVMTIFFTFSITLAFPVFASVVESNHTESKFKLFNKQIFVPFIYLIWNLGDLLGRVSCGFPRLNMVVTSPRILITYSLARLVFIPLFLTCNVHPGVSEPLIKSDIWYILLQLLFGISNGQLCTSSFMIVGKHCDTDDEKEAAGGFTSVFLSVGLAVGSIFSYLLVLVVNQ
ncbi:hypothetical protein KGF56_003825 [Candida oxycetoniae]|uniref:Nucleoside transporter FUN26 n=1 Tax=Candida oxycetoniae TaxID=497107 RepID=A0AAI9SVD7_9ASCO|nr:uncharacterized protein KGF56_003825 [Candida oxycetoniae]KAI3403404.2 hypothetical protein KGF56_003825 [Candida oxycetoniae]